MPDPRQPTIPTADWRRLTIGCRDQEEVRRVLAGYRDGYSAGQRSIGDHIHAAMLQAIATPQPPEETPQPNLHCFGCGGRTAMTMDGLCEACVEANR